MLQKAQLEVCQSGKLLKVSLVASAIDTGLYWLGCVDHQNARPQKDGGRQSQAANPRRAITLPNFLVSHLQLENQSNTKQNNPWARTMDHLIDRVV